MEMRSILMDGSHGFSWVLMGGVFLPSLSWLNPEMKEMVGEGQKRADEPCLSDYHEHVCMYACLRHTPYCTFTAIAA